MTAYSVYLCIILALALALFITGIIAIISQAKQDKIDREARAEKAKKQALFEKNAREIDKWRSSL